MKLSFSQLLVCGSLLAATTVNAGDFTRYVDPLIGTGAIDGGLSGNNYPGPTMPFGMVQLSPDTHTAPDWYNASGYNYNDSTIYGFSHTRLSGTGASDLIDLLLFPTSSDLTVSRFSHSREAARPGYYSVDLLDEEIRAELSATEHAGLHRYTFQSSKPRKVWIDLDHSAQKGSWNRQIINAQIRQISPTTIEGYRVITGWAKLRKIYFTIEFSEPVTSLTLSDDSRVYSNGVSNVVNGRAPRALVEFGVGDKPLVAKVGISGVSVENARQNLNSEVKGFDFDGCVDAADKAWDMALGKIEVEGGSDRDRTIFYTSLYHTLIQPNVFSDVNGQYMGADYSTRTVEPGHSQYTTFSLWDTYRGAHPLYTIIEPERSADFVNSMLDHCDAYGYLPIWQLWGQDNYCMIGNHAIPVIADAVLKELPGIDYERAYKAMKQSSENSHPNSPFEVWERYGYMPEELQSQSVSITLEMAFDDWCVAQVAKKLGYEADAERFMGRSRNFRNLHDSDTNFFRSKNAAGEWIEPFDPLRYGANGGYPFTEGNAWQYYWYVPHDVDALIELTGGRDAFDRKLDTFFTLTESSGEKNDNISGMIGQYAHGNEPSHHVAYLYNYIGKPEKTQRLVKEIMNNLYNTTSSGYAGNDDCGEMSAWYIFSAMGFYPVNPAGGEYSIGIPQFDRCTIHLPKGREFTVCAKRKKGNRVKSVKLNGSKLSTPVLKHNDIMAGGSLEFTLD